MKILNTYYNISTIVGWLTLSELIYIITLSYTPEINKIFTIQHEDYIFIAHLMTFFITKTIENLKINSNF